MTESNCINGRCFVPGGRFVMGSPSGEGYVDEYPQRSVVMSSFRMGQTEVSIGQYNGYLLYSMWKAFTSLDHARFAQLWNTTIEMNKGECGEMNGRGDHFPVGCLTMEEREDYCRVLGGELPTAAQVEYAARFDHKDGMADHFVIWDNGFRETVPVTAGYINRFGLYNLIGNVWEPTSDAYDGLFYTRMSRLDPHNPLTDPSSQKVEYRGGCLISSLKRYAQATSRGNEKPDSRISYAGLRCVWPVDPK